jgi:hypothetical protein
MKVKTKVNVNYAIRVGSRKRRSAKKKTFVPNSGKEWGWPRNLVLDPAKDYLENGTLKVYVDI